MERTIELRAKITYFDLKLNTEVEYNKLLNDLYKLILKEEIDEERARELIDSDTAYLVSIKRKVKE